MGALRLWLAISVVVGHLHFFGVMFPADLAVQCFYIISGFYMSLVLHTKYGASWTGTWVFYKNRYLRLAPTYWVVLILSAAVFSSTGNFPYGTTGSLSPLFKALSEIEKLWICFVNVFIVGQDWTLFTSIHESTGSLQFAPDLVAAGKYRTCHLLVVPQAWTIALELQFYTLAPIVLRLRLQHKLALAIASVALRLVLVYHGFKQDPWTYRFFPTELIFFLLGHFAYLLYNNGVVSAARGYLRGAAAILTVLIVTYPWVGAPGWHKQVLLYTMFTICIPGLFALTKTSKLDSMVGELSYPLYICHTLFLTAIWGEVGGLYDWHKALALVCCLGFSCLLVKYVERPLDRIRQRNLQAISPLEPG